MLWPGVFLRMAIFAPAGRDRIWRATAATRSW
jgi:hypothetical protein